VWKCADLSLAGIREKTTQIKKENMNQLQRYTAEADAITRGPQTPQTRSRVEFRISAIKTVKEMSEVRSVREEEHEARAEKAFDGYLRTGDVSEYRTYAPMTDSVQGAYIVPAQFANAYSERLKDFVGVREAGAQIITTVRSGSMKYATVDDTGNTGERLAETDAVTLANPTINSVSLSSYRYGSKGVQVSNELVEDSAFNLSAFLQNIFAKRVGRLTNQEFTLGGSSAMTGLVPSITNVVAAATVSAISMGDLVALQAIDEGYLPTACYQLNQTTERALRLEADSDGLRLYPELSNGMLLGFPVVRNNALSAAGANNFSAVFGSVTLGCTIRELAPQLVVSAERFAEFYQTYYSLIHRQDFVVNDVNALSVLQHPAS
jgi:HK97 family phage major capsid protein